MNKIKVVGKTKAGNTLYRQLTDAKDAININPTGIIIVRFYEWLEDSEGDMIGPKNIKSYKVVGDEFQKWFDLFGAQILGGVDSVLSVYDIENYLYPIVETEEVEEEIIEE